MNFKLPVITPKYKKVIAVVVYLAAVAGSFILSKPLFISLAILPVLYICVRFLPRKISWLPGLALFFTALLSAENALVHSSRGINPITLGWVNAFTCLVLVGICIRYAPKKISWLPCLLLLIVAGGTVKGLREIETTRVVPKDEVAVPATPEKIISEEALLKKKAAETPIEGPMPEVKMLAPATSQQNPATKE